MKVYGYPIWENSYKEYQSRAKCSNNPISTNPLEHSGLVYINGQALCLNLKCRAKPTNFEDMKAKPVESQIGQLWHAVFK